VSVKAWEPRLGREEGGVGVKDIVKNNDGGGKKARSDATSIYYHSSAASTILLNQGVEGSQDVGTLSWPYILALQEARSRAPKFPLAKLG
jgi:hypothetical protein